MTKGGIPLDYEQNIQLLEAQIRGHYSVQNQLKLHIEITENEHEIAIKQLKQELTD